MSGEWMFPSEEMVGEWCEVIVDEMVERAPHLRRVVHRAARPLPSRRGCALLRRVPTPVVPSANQRHLSALAA